MVCATVSQVFLEEGGTDAIKHVIFEGQIYVIAC